MWTRVGWIAVFLPEVYAQHHRCRRSSYLSKECTKVEIGQKKWNLQEPRTRTQSHQCGACWLSTHRVRSKDELMPALEDFAQGSNVVSVCCLDESLATGQRMNVGRAGIVKPVNRTLNTRSCCEISQDCWKPCHSSASQNQTLACRKGRSGGCTLPQNSRAGKCPSVWPDSPGEDNPRDPKYTKLEAQEKAHQQCDSSVLKFQRAHRPEFILPLPPNKTLLLLGNTGMKWHVSF